MVDDDRPQKRPVLGVVGSLAKEVVNRGKRLGAEIGEHGLVEALSWEDQPHGYAVWARLMHAYLHDLGDRLQIEALDVVMWRWKKTARRQCARFLELRAMVEWNRGRKDIAHYMLFYACTIFQGRDLNAEAQFVDKAGYSIGDCRKCGHQISMEDFTGCLVKTEPGERFRHGNAIYACTNCSSEWPARRILEPNRHYPWKGPTP